MKSIEFENGKLYTEMRLKFKENVHTSHKMVIDTTSSYTMISQDLAKKLNIPLPNDENHPRQTIDSVNVGPLKLSDFEVFIIKHDDDGMIGLDFLKKVGAKINLDSMTISSSRT